MLVNVVRPILCALLFLTWPLCAEVTQGNAHKFHTFNVMAPLYLKDEQAWQQFDIRLARAKAMGIDGVSVDVWWGMVEGEKDQQFDWRYYHRIAELLRKHQLQWVPIMSFHQCGGNVGDDCDIPIPGWIWQAFDSNNEQALQFRSEQGNDSAESLAFWQWEDNLEAIYAQYEEFMRAFEAEFADDADIIQELNVSMGPAGELRYPSYNSHDKGSGFPSRGLLQGFSEPAKQSFEKHLLARYKDIRHLNRVWGTRFASFKHITYPASFQTVFEQGNHFKPGVSQDYLQWYHQSLIKHGARFLAAAHRGFNKAFHHLPLGYKIPGIHWQIANTGGMYRSAELAAGLIPPVGHKAANLWGYHDILSLASEFQQHTGRTVIAHFTALEMRDQPEAPQFSRAKTLVSWLGKSANTLGVIIKGENALATGVHSEEGWRNIQDALENQHYSGLTVLRINDVVTLEGHSLGQAAYTRLIRSLSASFVE